MSTTTDHDLRPGSSSVTGIDQAASSAARRVRGPMAVLQYFDDKPTVSYYVILTTVLLLLGIGVLMVFSASTITQLRAGESPYSEFVDQGRFAAVGLLGMFVAMRLPVRFYRVAAPWLLGATLLLQLLVFTPLGIDQGGNRNWIRLPGIGTLQPSELVKLGLCLFLGAALAGRMGRLSHWKQIVVPGMLVSALAIGLVLLGHDMGTVLVMVALVAGVYWFAGLGLQWFGAAAGLGVVAMILLVVSSPSRTKRVLDFLGLGAADPSGTGFQTQHGLWALGTGGIGGVGLGASREKWVPLPEAHNDFIFAIIGEELGLVGALLVVGLFVVLGWAMLRLAHRHPEPFVALATGGIFTWIVTQAFINIGVVIGLLPVIGIPLPLVSAGGSALVSTLAAMGVLLAFARDEPGARAALSARRGTVARSMAVLGRRGRTVTRPGGARPTRTGRPASADPTPIRPTKGTP